MVLDTKLGSVGVTDDTRLRSAGKDQAQRPQGIAHVNNAAQAHTRQPIEPNGKERRVTVECDCRIP